MTLAATEPTQPEQYPVRLWMEYPERLSRLATFFRIILSIPVLIFLALLGGESLNFSGWGDQGQATNPGAGAGAIGGSIVIAIWVTIVLRRNIPRWLFDFQVGLNRFSYRAYAYFTLLTDKYPAFEGDWRLQYWVDYPERLSRWKVFFWKIITAIPHFIVLIGLTIASLVVVVIAWFAILFTGAFPRGLHTFVVGVLRWQARVGAYVESLTDAFPPFSMDHDAGPGSKRSETICAIIGGLVMAAIVAGLVAVVLFFIIFLRQEKSRDLTYADLTSGDVPVSSARIEMDDVSFTLVQGEDPALSGELAARPGRRLVKVTILYRGEESGFTFGESGDVGTRKIDRDSVRLETDGDSSINPALLTFDGVAAPLRVDELATGELAAFFEVDEDDTVEELRAYPNANTDRHVAWQFE